MKVRAEICLFLFRRQVLTERRKMWTNKGLKSQTTIVRRAKSERYSRL